MSVRVHLLTAVAVVVCCIANPAPAASVILQPVETDSKDAFVYEFLPAFNFDSDSSVPFGAVLAASNTGTASAHNTKSVLEFDVASMGLASGDVLNATISLYAVDGSSVGFPFANASVADPIDIDLYALGAAWVENTVSWDTTPGVAGGLVDSATMNGIDQWYSFDVTALVKDWLDGTVTNNGMLIEQRDEVRTAGGVAVAGVFESSASAHRPVLEVITVPEPCAGLLLTGAVLLTVRRRRR